MPDLSPARNRLLYGLLTIITLLAGFLSRRLFGDHAFIKLYVGDALWALMVFFGFAFLLRRRSTLAVAAAALGFSVSIEISQLYHAPWIDDLRKIPLIALVLGFQFVWSDLICYSIGVGTGVLAEICFIQPFKEYRMAAKKQ
ncbi:DUF2809 domain-containing protein [Dyadobacter flavalbus]|uniref:DUF2809 domain-containing protein n=2 Tax=Dyadobacter flavalbus TaxID=2579942 RepID=A0A5M8QW25_9BACT|nr:DUF2809 domain-containing protein [Dyadobacter flavalbus]